MPIFFYEYPIGSVGIQEQNEQIIGLHIKQYAPQDDCYESALLREANSQLKSYFAGALRAFSLPLCMSGTDFQNIVWRELLRIPYGQRITYAELAARTGRPSAARAAGAACGKNKIPIIIPCHRVVGAGNRLTGFAWGLSVKEKLLALEELA